MAQTDRQQAVLGILQDLRSLDGLKRLFWQELNYERENKPLSPRQWPDAARDALAEEPTLFASAGADGAFHIVYCRLASGDLRRGPQRPVPEGYNQAVMAIQRQFAEEVRHREAERSYTANLTHGQLYVLRELRMLFEATADDDIKQNVTVLEKVLRGALTGAVKRELNQLRRNLVTGEGLLKSLIRIYDQHNLKDASTQRSLAMSDKAVPRIICSEAFV